MSVFFTSDMHFGHSRILELGEGRPFQTISQHDMFICERWMETVDSDDIVYVMGDAVMGSEFERTIKLFASLPGDKKFIPGNHDKIFSGTNSKARIEKYTPMYEDVGFEILPENTEIVFTTSYGEQRVLLSHFPYSGDSHSAVDRYAKHRYLNEGLPIVHGHTHSRSVLNPDNLLEYHVGVDSHGFAPVPETKIVAWLEQLKQGGVL